MVWDAKLAAANWVCETKRIASAPDQPSPLTIPRHVVELAPGVIMAFRLIPPGSFRMGSRGYRAEEEPIHEVRIPEAFWLGETPVTQAQFAVWTSAAKEEHANEFGGDPDRPAESLDWRQANSFCDWLTRVHGDQLPEDASFACLPTEAEWEYACRAGTETEYYSGDGEGALAEAGWFGQVVVVGFTLPVGQKRANSFGLFDLHGNVWEWCHDVWQNEPYRLRVDGEDDPRGKQRRAEWAAGLTPMLKSDRRRARRGGSWDDAARDCRSASRDAGKPGARTWFYGFRVCLVRGPSASAGAEAPPSPGDGVRPSEAKTRNR